MPINLPGIDCPSPDGFRHSRIFLDGLLLTFLNAADQSPFAWNYQIKKTLAKGRVK
jgi:hypothetical protein